MALHLKLWEQTRRQHEARGGENCSESHLTHDGSAVRQLVAIPCVGHPMPSYDRIEFGLRFVHYAGVENHCENEDMLHGGCLNKSFS